MYTPYQSVVSLIVILVLILIFFALRSLVLWYWGIQRRIEQNDEIILLLKYIAAGKTIPVQPVQGAQSVLPPVVNPLTKRP